MKGKLRHAALAATLLAGVALATQDGVLLRRELKENSVEKYRLEMKMSTVMEVPGAGEQEMNVTTVSGYELKVGKVDAAKGVAVVQATTTVEKMDADGMMAGAVEGQKLPPPMVLKGTLDRQYRLKLNAPKGIGPTEMFGSQTSSLMSTSIELPEKPVKVGESWKIVLPKNAMSKKDQELTATLRGEKEFEGRQVWIVGLEGKFKMEMEPRPMPKNPDGPPNPLAGEKMGMKADVQVTGEGLLDKQTCQLVYQTNKAKTAQTIEFPGVGMSITSNSTMDVVMKLIS